jgi:hypothetical protein
MAIFNRLGKILSNYSLRLESQHLGGPQFLKPANTESRKKPKSTFRLVTSFPISSLVLRAADICFSTKNFRYDIKMIYDWLNTGGTN